MTFVDWIRELGGGRGQSPHNERATHAPPPRARQAAASAKCSHGAPRGWAPYPHLQGCRVGVGTYGDIPAYVGVGAYVGAYVGGRRRIPT